VIGARNAGERRAFAFRARFVLGFGLARRFSLGDLHVDRIAPIAKQLARRVGRIARVGQRFAGVGDAVPNCGAKAQLATFAGRRRKPKDPGCAVRLDAQHQATAIAHITGAGRLNLPRAEQIPGHFDVAFPRLSPGNSFVGAHG